MSEAGEPPLEATESALGRPGKLAGLFQGVPPNCERGPDGRIRRKPVEPLSDEQEDMLTAMKWVESHVEGQDRTNQQREYRGWLKKFPLQFAKMRVDLEKAALGSAARSSSLAQPKDGPAVPETSASLTSLSKDEGRERALEAIERLLGSYGEAKHVEPGKVARTGAQGTPGEPGVASLAAGPGV